MKLTSDYPNKWNTIKEFEPHEDTINYFLVQVSKDGSSNLHNNLAYQNTRWKDNIRDLDHGLLKEGDILTAYFAKKAIKDKQQIKKIYKVKEVTEDKTKIKVDEIQDLDGLSLETIQNAVKEQKLSRVFSNLDRQGLNVARISKKDYETLIETSQSIRNGGTLGGNDNRGKEDSH